MPLTPLATRLLVCAAVLLPGAPLAQDGAPPERDLRQKSTHVGMMMGGAGGLLVDDPLRFEPYQMRDEIFDRSDIVYLMRHGPTDWSKRDAKNVAPTDCADQRVLSPAGRDRMRHLGRLLGVNAVAPGRIVVSEWCRNQQTLDALSAGYDSVDPALLAGVPVETDPALNLLLSLQGAPNVTGLEARIADWSGEPGRDGPLLIITHFTNIEELTQFSVFEGEILVIDPKRDSRVIATLRLQSASPDVGHFQTDLDDTVSESAARDMVQRYYAALDTGNFADLDALLSEDWRDHTGAGSAGDQKIDAFLSELSRYRSGLSGARFEIDDIHMVDDVVTVLGTVRGQHTGDLFGHPATGREVAFGSIAVHRVSGSQIVESWQMADRQSLIRQITD